MSRKNHGVFITGTDTDVGKTYISCQIIQQLRRTAAKVSVFKPIESGCKRLDNQLIPADGFALQQANHNSQSLEEITPFRFEPAIAPDLAAKRAEVEIRMEDLANHCIKHSGPTDFLAVEGAGGFYSPLTAKGLNADLAKTLGLDIVLVVADKLGCINHTLLTLQAIESYSLIPRLIVLNQTTEEPTDQYDHFAELSRRSQIPVIKCSYGGSLPDCQQYLQ